MLSSHRSSLSQDGGVVEPKSVSQGSLHSHEPSSIGMYHDGPGGHLHDDDGHTHHAQHHHDPSTIGQFHDGPGGHHHDSDGHIHHDQQHHRSGQHHKEDGHHHVAKSAKQSE